jgi:hypothetical protein
LQHERERLHRIAERKALGEISDQHRAPPSKDTQCRAREQVSDMKTTPTSRAGASSKMKTTPVPCTGVGLLKKPQQHGRDVFSLATWT